MLSPSVSETKRQTPNYNSVLSHLSLCVVETSGFKEHALGCWWAFLRIRILFIFSNLLCGLAWPAKPIQLWPGMHLILIWLILTPKWTSWSSPLYFSWSVVSDSVTSWTTAHQASLSLTISWSLLKLMSIESVMPSNHLNLCRPLLFLAFNLSQHQGLFLPSGGQSIGTSASASVFPMNIQGWFPLGLTGLISLQSKGLLWVFSSTAVRKHQFFGSQHFLWYNCHIRTWLMEKP